VDSQEARQNGFYYNQVDTMIPIAIVTRDRHQYLDLTLRSLSATTLPDDQVVNVFDDCSCDEDTISYLYSDKEVNTSMWVPSDKTWMNNGLGPVRPRDKAKGLADRVLVYRVGDDPVGVMNASCRAIRRMMEYHGDTIEKNGLFLIQDDVVFNVDWQKRMNTARARVRSKKPKLGLLAGMRLNTPMKQRRPNPFLVNKHGVTAQLYYLTAKGIEAIDWWLHQHHSHNKGFDNKMCAKIRSHNLGVYMMNPPVCQHIGVVSAVRPSWGWKKWSHKGRVCYQSKGPYVMAKDVKEFAS
jgi:hypothetical protein